MTHEQHRTALLARALSMTPLRSVELKRETGLRHRWWITGCIEGDQPLPNTARARNAGEAISAVEAWLNRGRA